MKDIESFIQEEKMLFNSFSQMLSKTVHDMNNPLAVLIGQISIYQILKEKDELDEKKLEMIFTKINSATEVFQKRIFHLRNFYKTVTNDEHFQHFDQVFYSAYYFIENKAYTHEINIEYDTPPTVELNCPADEVFLILKSLLINAIEATIDSKNTPRKISIKFDQKAQALDVSIRDTAPPLNVPLEKACSTDYTTHSHKNKGLGLALVNNLCQKNNLKWGYHAENPKNFQITFPLKNI